MQLCAGFWASNLGDDRGRREHGALVRVQRCAQFPDACEDGGRRSRERAELRAQGRARRAGEQHDLCLAILRFLEDLPDDEPPPETLVSVISSIDADLRDRVAEITDWLQSDLDVTRTVLQPNAPPEQLAPHAEHLALNLHAESRAANALGTYARLPEEFRRRGWL